MVMVHKYGPVEQVISLGDRSECMERCKAVKTDVGIFVFLPKLSGIINGYRPPEHLMGRPGWKAREKEEEGLTEGGGGEG